MTDYIDTPQGRRLAYVLTPGQGTGIVFLGGFMSDMDGSKATALEAWARAQGRPFLRFDYSGHGQSSGDFRDGAIGDWAEDARAIIEALTEGPQVVVGSSMGGWIALLLARAVPERFAGFVGIAAAPDFTEDSFWEGFSPAARTELMEAGVIMVPSDYAEPYPVTRRLIEEGRRNLVLRAPLALPFPVRLLQGTADTAVSVETALQLFDHVTGDDIRLTLVKGADHSFSTPACLAAIQAVIDEVSS